MKATILLCTLIISYYGHAQNKAWELNDIINLAITRSPTYNLTKTQAEISYYQYLAFKSNYRPQISIYGDIPSFDKEFYGVRQPNGSIKFQSIKQNNTNLGFSLSQPLAWTGGEISLNSSYSRFDDFNAKSKQYNAIPVYFHLSQSLFGYNDLKWKKKIEPLKLEESKYEFARQVETIAWQTIKYYFDVLEAQTNITITDGNLKSAATNYEIEKKRLNLGTTTEDKLLQLELQVMRNTQDIDKYKYQNQIAQLNLKTYVGITDTNDIMLALPERIPDFRIDVERSVEMARKNCPQNISFERKKLEAERDVAQAKAGQKQIQISLSYGLNNVGNEFTDVYKNPYSQQRLGIGFNIPVVDWGRAKARYNTAKASEKLIKYNNDIEQANYVLEIYTFIGNFNYLQNNIALAKKTEILAEKRYSTAYNLYKSGNLSITDLTLAQAEKDNAKRNYIVSLREYWDAYYLLRRLTLFDFEKNESLLKK
ncbi:MAG TPA: TolC family protein [Niastella sp.]